MPPRFYCPELVDGEVTIEGDEAHHLRSVRRLGPGDVVELFDGQGRLAECEVVRLDRRRATLCTGNITTADPPARRWVIATAIPKAGRMDTLVEKVTELGISAVWPMVTEHSSVTASRHEKQRSWQRRAVEACKQCGQLFVPEIAPVASLEEVARRLQAESPDLVLLADLCPEAVPVSEALTKAESPTCTVALIGPEGGFADAERQQLQAVGAKAVLLTNTILRIETAAIAVAAAMMMRTQCNG